MSISTAPQLHTPWPRIAAIGVGLAAIVSILVIAFLWPSITSSVKDLPIALVGDPAQTSQFESAIEERSPHTFAFVEAADRAEAVDLIETREAYGAIILSQQPEVLTASAASPLVSQLLSGLAASLQAQLVAEFAAQGIQPPSPVTVQVTDIVPLASTDPRGTALVGASFPLVLGGMLGGIAISVAVIGVWRRVTALVAYAVVAGLSLAGIMQGWFGGLQGNYLLNASAIALALLAIGGVIVGFVSIFGRIGVAVGPILFLLIANPIAAAAQPVEFLAQPWGAVGQWFPPGAAATLLRELSYFPRADTLFPWLVLAGWAVAGLLLAAVGHFRNSGAATRAALAEAEA